VFGATRDGVDAPAVGQVASRSFFAVRASTRYMVHDRVERSKLKKSSSSWSIHDSGPVESFLFRSRRKSGTGKQTIQSKSTVLFWRQANILGTAIKLLNWCGRQEKST
jgi:hypothetical protein